MYVRRRRRRRKWNSNYPPLYYTYTDQSKQSYLEQGEVQYIKIREASYVKFESNKELVEGTKEWNYKGLFLVSLVN